MRNTPAEARTTGGLDTNHSMDHLFARAVGAGPGAGRPRPTSAKSLLERLADAVVPPTTPHDENTPDDYRRAVLLIAALAVGFFIPSLPLAGVPQDRWLGFAALTAVTGIVVAGSFVLVRRGSLLIYPWVLVCAAMLGILGSTFAPYYHQIVVAYCLTVAAHAIVHGFGAAIVMAAIGSVVVPFVIEGGAANATDPVYAAIYLLGIAIIPWVAERLARRRLVEVRRNLEGVIRTEREAVQMLARAAEAKDDVTGDHVLRVGELSARLAIATGEAASFVDDLRFAAMLHDVGKLHVPDAILMKPGRLGPAEWDKVRRHTIWGERILGSTDSFELARRVARSHHENWNGTGYPDGLAGEQTPLAARIVHLADVFDALLARRPYKPAWPLERCLEEIAQQSGRMFDPELTREFLAIVQIPMIGDLLDSDQTSLAAAARRRTKEGPFAADRPSSSLAS
jgi:hypothetical protein